VRAPAAEALGDMGAWAKIAVKSLSESLLAPGQEVYVLRSVATALGNMGPDAAKRCPERLLFRSPEAIHINCERHFPLFLIDRFDCHHLVFKPLSLLCLFRDRLGGPGRAVAASASSAIPTPETELEIAMTPLLRKRYKRRLNQPRKMC
jgi:hypothetical protein